MAGMLSPREKQPRIKEKPHQTKRTLSKVMAFMMISTALSPACMHSSDASAKSTRSFFKFYTTAEHDIALNEANDAIEKLEDSIGRLTNEPDRRKYEKKNRDLKKLMLNANSYFLTKNKLDAYDNVRDSAYRLTTHIARLLEKEANDQKILKEQHAELEASYSAAQDQMSLLHAAFAALTTDANRTLFGKHLASLEHLLSEADSCTSASDRLRLYNKICKDADRLIQQISDSVNQELENARKQAVKDAESLKKFQDERFELLKTNLISALISHRDGIDTCLIDFDQADSYTPIADSLKLSAANLISRLESLALRDDLRTENLDDYDKNLNTLFSTINADIKSWMGDLEAFSKDVERIKDEIRQAEINQAKEDLFNRLQDLESDIKSKFSVDGLEEFEQKAINSILEMKDKLLKKIDSLHDYIYDSVVDLKTTAEAEKNFSLLKKETDRYEKAKTKIMDGVKQRREKEELLASKQDFFRQLSLLRSGKLRLDQVVGGNEKIIAKLDELVNLYKYRQETGKGNPSKGLILFGDPGTGKTTTVEAWTESHNYNLVILKRGVSDIDLVPEINAKFTEAKNLASNGKPTILLVDEIDAIGSKRIVGKTDKETVSFMGQLDNLKFSDNVIVIATTNSLSSVDPAVKRPGRLEIQVEMTLPSDDDILKVGRICLEGFKFEGDQDVDSFIPTVLPYLRGSTPAKTKRICESAIASNMSSKHISAYRDVVLTVNDIVSAAQQYSD